MKVDIKNIIESGQLELYALGALTPEEKRELDELLAEYPELNAELEAINATLESYALALAVPPPPTVKPFVFGMIEYLEKDAQGKISKEPVPELNINSKKEDFALWLDAPENILPTDFKDFHAIIIGKNDTMTSAITWINEGAPHETHNEHIEKFLVLEGSCEIVIEDEVHVLIEGDYLAIPLYKEHYVKVTSKNPCKLILQRVAA